MVVASGDVRLSRFLRREAGAEVDRLYRRHADDVLRYAMLVLRSRTDAEDITQTVFLRALRAIERGEKVRTPRNWLIKIAHNECRRLLSTRKVHAELPDEIAVEPAERGRAEELRTAMEALPATQRQALVMRELEGRSYVDISKALDISFSAVETLIFRARRALREQIENAVSCEEFAQLLEDPSARARVRSHARMCADCATLDRQMRGRKSALKRVASSFGLPWWGSKLAAVALTTATVAAVAVPVRPVNSRPNPIAPRTHVNVSQTPAVATGFTPSAPRHAVARPVVATPKKVSDTARVVVSDTVATSSSSPAVILHPLVIPGPKTPTPTPVPPEPEPTPAPSPMEAAPPASAQVGPTVTAPQPVVPPAIEVPAVTLPTVSVPVPVLPVPAVTVPVATVTVPVQTPNVSLP